jgi:hypothetical protein
MKIDISIIEVLHHKVQTYVKQKIPRQGNEKHKEQKGGSDRMMEEVR